MDITLTWDLFVVVFFALVITYSFIIGKHESVKVIVASYVAIVAVQGIGNLIDRFSGESEPLLSVLGLTVDITLLATTKLVLFVAAIIILAVKSGVEIEFHRESGSAVDLVITGAFGFATAGLLITTLVTYVADVPLLSKSIVNAATVAGIISGSRLMSMIVLNQDILFALPALLLLLVGLVSREPD